MANYIWPEITTDTPMEEIKRIHKAIWDYAIEHGRKPNTPYISNCVACKYNSLYAIFCVDCPVIWPKNDDGNRLCIISNGLYSKWEKATGEEKTELAKQIRDLPWKFEIEENTTL